MTIRKAMSMLIVGLVLFTLGGVSAQTPSEPQAQQATTLGTAFTYQGRLNSGNTPVNAACNFEFSLWDSATGGTQVGTQSTPGVNVVQGLFTVQLDFGAGAFTGTAVWLQTAVQCPGDAGFTTLSPRQPITATPYALSLRPGAVIEGDASISTTLRSINQAKDGAGIVGQSTALNGSGVRGVALSGVHATGVQGDSWEGAGVSGGSENGYGVFGYSWNSNKAGVLDNQLF